MDTAFQVLKDVNQLYNNTFSHLVTYTVGLIAFVGVLVPLVIQYLQSKSLHNEYENMISIIKGEISNIESKLRKELLESLKKDVGELITAETTQLKKELSKEASKSRGGIFFLQGNQRILSLNYVLAIPDFCTAAKEFIMAEDEPNAQRALNHIHESCLPKIFKTDFDDPSDLSNRIESLLAFLKKNNPNGRYSNYIDLIETKMKYAKSRENKPPNPQLKLTE